MSKYGINNMGESQVASEDINYSVIKEMNATRSTNQKKYMRICIPETFQQTKPTIILNISRA